MVKLTIQPVSCWGVDFCGKNYLVCTLQLSLHEAAGRVSSRVNKMQMTTPAHSAKGLFKYWLLARILRPALNPLLWTSLTPPVPSPPPSPLFMDSGTPDILMVSAMPPMAATFIFMASSCPRHLLGHLGKTRVAQAAPTATAATRPCEQFLRPEKATNESDLCSQSEVSGDLGPGGSEGWDGMLKCLNCGLRCIGGGEGGGEGEGHQTLSSKANLSGPYGP